MGDSVPLQEIVAKYRQQLDEVTYQLVCHKVLVEQKDNEIRELKASIADLANKENNENS